MKPTLAALLLLSLVLTGCVVDPGHGYGGRGYGDRGPEYQRHAEFHGDQDQERVWVR
jgi:hypothetical protein